MCCSVRLGLGLCLISTLCFLPGHVLCVPAMFSTKNFKLGIHVFSQLLQRYSRSTDCCCRLHPAQRGLMCLPSARRQVARHVRCPQSHCGTRLQGTHLLAHDALPRRLACCLNNTILLSRKQFCCSLNIIFNVCLLLLFCHYLQLDFYAGLL
jgi:hypothetical protein